MSYGQECELIREDEASGVAFRTPPLVLLISWTLERPKDDRRRDAVNFKSDI
jgi:hypothetical protein